MILLDRIFSSIRSHAVERLFGNFVVVDYFKRLLSLHKARWFEFGLLDCVQVHLAFGNVVELVCRRTITRGWPGIIVRSENVVVVCQNGGLSSWCLLVLKLLFASLAVDLFGSIETPSRQ